MSDLHTVRARLLSLIYPMGESLMTAEQPAAFEEAVQIQSGFEESGGEASVKSRSVGDVSVTYQTPASCVFTDGSPVSPSALAVLKAAGLLCRWV